MSAQDKPVVTMDAEVEFFYPDVTKVLDGWSLDEVREFVEDPDEEGIQILRDECQAEEEARWPSFGGAPLEDYLAWREAEAKA